MNYRINLGAWESVFAVPSCVADSYIKIADGKQLKVLLYLLKNAGAPLSSEDIAAAAGLETCDVDDALLFWTNLKVLSASGEELLPSGNAPAAQTAANSGFSAEAMAKLRADTQFPPREIASAVNKDESVRYLFETYERLAGRPTKHAERNALMLLIEEIGMPCEVAVMLVEYCFSVDKASPAYMKAAALEWCESGIDTIGKAEERIKLLKSRYSLESMLRSKYSVTTAFSKSQKEIIDEWARAGYPYELIDEAYDRSMTNAGKFSLSYMNKTLQSWADKGITTAEQARNDKKPQSVSSSFGTDELKQAAFAKYKKLGGNGQ